MRLKIWGPEIPSPLGRVSGQLIGGRGWPLWIWRRCVIGASGGATSSGGAAVPTCGIAATGVALPDTWPGGAGVRGGVPRVITRSSPRSISLVRGRAPRTGGAHPRIVRWGGVKPPHPWLLSGGSCRGSPGQWRGRRRTVGCPRHPPLHRVGPLGSPPSCGGASHGPPTYAGGSGGSRLLCARSRRVGGSPVVA